MAAITIVDESTLGEKRSWQLDILEETISLRELISRRIYQEVTEYNAKQTGIFYGLVQPTATERALNGFRLKPAQRIDWQQQKEQALAAFTRRGYIVLVNERQVSDLDMHITLSTHTEVIFLKLVPLVGG